MDEEGAGPLPRLQRRLFVLGVAATLALAVYALPAAWDS